MSKMKRLLVLILCSFSVEETTANCSTISSMYYNVKWANTSSEWALSQPPCTGKNKEFLYRECNNGLWKNEPLCHYVQFDDPPQCPDGFFYKDMCYTISQPSTFPPKCPFEDVLPFNDYVGVLEDVIQATGPIWMPVKRDSSDGLGFLQWTEASKLYKTDYVGDYVVSGAISNKECLIYHNNSCIEAVSCDEEHVSICAYYKLDEITGQLCQNSEDRCRQSDFTADSKCFCLRNSKIPSTFSKAEFLKPYQNHVYKRLTSEPCTIGLEKINRSYIWSTSGNEIDYTFWSKVVIFHPTHVYGAMTSDGWILTKKSLKCVLYQRPRDYLEPRLDLDFTKNKFVLSIYNPRALKQHSSEVLLFCFTNAGSSNLVYRYSNFSKVEHSDWLIKFSFEPLQSGPGHYWCEAFKYLNLEVIKSNRFFHRQSDVFKNEFVAILKIEYTRGYNFVNSNFTQFLKKVLNIIFRNILRLKKFYIFRIMKILSVNEYKKEVTVNVHLTSVKQDRNNAQIDRIDQIRRMVEESLNFIEDVNIEVVDLVSSDFCVNETESGLTWPKTALGSVSASQEFCINDDGSRQTRKCVGDFINGARWMNKTGGSCKILHHSSLTRDLISILNNRREDNIIMLKELSERHSEFTSFDLYLFGDILQTFVNFTTNTQLNLISETISNVMDIDQTVLLESHVTLNATNRILEAIDKIIASHSNPVEVHKSNFHLFIANSTEFSGVLVLQNNEITKIQQNCSLEDIKSQNDLKSAVWLSPLLVSQLNETSKIKIIIFCKDSLFVNDIKPATKALNTVFLITFPGINELFAGPIWMLDESQQVDQVHCSFWRYGYTEQGFWVRDGDSKKLSQFSLCEFYHISYLALTTISTREPVRTNITDGLLDILDSDQSPNEMLANVLNLSARHKEFTSIDVYLVGRIFKKVSRDRNVDLEVLTKIVNNMHVVNRETLQISQWKQGATDSILFYIDEIVKNHYYESPIDATSDYFKLFIHTKKNFSGLMVVENNNTLEVKMLDGDVDINDLANYYNFDSAVWLSPQLKDQLEDDDIIIITVFANDALFNEMETPSHQVTKIFGVILPPLGNYSGPISVLHKVTKVKSECVHWDYQTNFEGAWVKNEDGKELSSVIYCGFMHTTHFALLLLDTDKYDNRILPWITTITCSLSTFGLFCIICTAVLFKRWRDNKAHQILLNFVFAMLLQISSFYFSYSVDQHFNDYIPCTITGLVLHYSIISVFCWMLVIAILQFKRFVQVFGGPPKHILLKSCFCGWAIPVIPVASVYFLDSDNYVNSKVGLCYPSHLGLYLGVWLPTGIIIAINFIIFAAIIYNVVHKNTDCGVVVGNNETMSQLRLALLLFFMLGLTWIFGFLSELDFGEIFVYMFCTTATLQGFVMFLFFIVFNASTRYLYVQGIKRCCNGY